MTDATSIEADIAAVVAQPAPPTTIDLTRKITADEAQERRETIEQAKARVALEGRIAEIAEASLIDGWFRAKLAAGERGVVPADVEIIHTMQGCAAKILARRQEVA